MTDPPTDSQSVSHSWGQGPEVVFLSNPLADPISWSAPVRSALLEAGYRVTTFEHRCPGLDWRSVVRCVVDFIAERSGPVALIGWSQGAALAQEVALVAPNDVTCVALLTTYARQNEIDKILQASWNQLASGGPELDQLRLAMALLTAFPPGQLADDGFVAHMRATQSDWAAQPAQDRRLRSAEFIATYQDRLEHLAAMRVPALVLSFELDTDTFASRAREVADAIPHATLVELPGLGHAAPFSAPTQVWPPVIDFVKRNHSG